jgi:hypothetical protein
VLARGLLVSRNLLDHGQRGVVLALTKVQPYVEVSNAFSMTFGE